MKAVSRFLCVSILAICCGACGGGGIDITVDPPTPLPGEPQVTVEGQTKRLVFSWAAVNGADHYRLMENPDGHSGFTQVGDNIPVGTLAASRDVAVHLFDWVNAQYLVQACNVTGCSDSEIVTVTDLMLNTIGYFKSSDTEPFDGFGSGIALSADGNTLAVSSGSFFTIAVHVFRRNGPSWLPGIPISVPLLPGSALPEVALSADGNTLVLGAPDYDGDPGSALVFRYNGTDWIRTAWFKGSRDGARYDRESGDYFGEAIAINAGGDILAIGAENAGRVYLFHFDGANWNQQTLLENPPNTFFGEDVSLSADGHRLAVGAPDDQAGGEVYMYGYDGTDWALETRIKANNSDDGDSFGTVSLSADGNILLVGDGSEDSSATGINGDQSDNSAYGSGALYVFRFNGTNWSQESYIKASNTESLDYLGRNIALSADGDTIAAAATREGSSARGINGDQSDNSARLSGAVYLFKFDGTNWSQQAYIKAPNTDSEDWFGGGLALTADGATLAVGASGEDSAATGVNGDSTDNSSDRAGAVYVY
jgi:hypothetical protein